MTDQPNSDCQPGGGGGMSTVAESFIFRQLCEELLKPNSHVYTCAECSA